MESLGLQIGNLRVYLRPIRGLGAVDRGDVRISSGKRDSCSGNEAHVRPVRQPVDMIRADHPGANRMLRIRARPEVDGYPW